MASETLYFIKSGQYSPWTCHWLVRALARYDALLCIGDMQGELARSLLGTRQMPIFSVPGAVSSERMPILGANRPALDSKHLVCVANGPGGWRTWYKGLDLLVDAFDRVATCHPDARLTIAGDWDDATTAELLGRAPMARDRVRFAGPQADITQVLREACLYVHLGRGDAFPLAVLEAMCAGVPAIVSEWTGTRQAVRDVHDTMVVPLNPEAAAARITEYLGTSHEARVRYSQAARAVGLTYTEARAIQAFRAAVGALSAAAHNSL